MTAVERPAPSGASRTAYAGIRAGGGDTATPLNVEKRLAVLDRYLGPAHRRLLDCGCGEGEYVRALRSRGLDAHGVELAHEKVAAAHATDDLVDVVRHGDLERLDFPDAGFDAAMFNEVLEHVPDEGAALREARRVLRPGGRLVALSPNRFYPFETHGVTLRRSGRALPPASPFVPWVPLAVGRHVFDYRARNYWPHELRRVIAGAGFVVVATDVVWQTFENISGSQPSLLRSARPFLRAACSALEATPVLRWLGVSQVVVGEKMR